MRHVVIGAGPAGIVAAQTLRAADPGSSVVVIGDEPEPPYSRMALPYLLAGHIEEPGTWLRRDPSQLAAAGVEVRHGRVASLAADAREIALEDGGSVGFDRLLIASGAHPLRPPIEGMDLPGVESCWTLADARRIAARAVPGSRVVLIGAGFIGCIVLEALAARGVDLTVVETADRMLARMMDATGGEMIERWCTGRGVRVLTGNAVESISAEADALRLALAGGEALSADLVVCATGVAPNVAFLDGTGIAIDHGVLVDDHLRTSLDGVYAAGDVAQGPDLSTGRQEVHAIQPTAVDHGRVAALNMAGRATRYPGSLSMNVLNTLGLISSSFGLWDGVEGGERAIASDPRRFSYLRLELDGDRVVGALALGLTQHVGVLRGLVQTRVRLGPWRERLLRDPHRIMEAYLERTQGGARLTVDAWDAA